MTRNNIRPNVVALLQTGEWTGKVIDAAAVAEAIPGASRRQVLQVLANITATGQYPITRVGFGLYRWDGNNRPGDEVLTLRVVQRSKSRIAAVDPEGAIYVVTKVEI